MGLIDFTINNFWEIFFFYNNNEAIQLKALVPDKDSQPAIYRRITMSPIFMVLKVYLNKVCMSQKFCLQVTILSLTTAQNISLIGYRKCVFQTQRDVFIWNKEILFYENTDVHAVNTQ